MTLSPNIAISSEINTPNHDGTADDSPQAMQTDTDSNEEQDDGTTNLNEANPSGNSSHAMQIDSNVDSDMVSLLIIFFFGKKLQFVSISGITKWFADSNSWHKR